MHFGIPAVPYCNQIIKHAAERCPCNYNTRKPGSRHTAHGPCTKKALNVLSEDIFFFAVLCIHMTVDKNQHNGSSPYTTQHTP